MKQVVFTDPPVALSPGMVQQVLQLPGFKIRCYQEFAADTEELYERGKDAEIIITDLTQYKDVLRRWPKLEVIITTSVGTDHIDTVYCGERGIRVINFPGYNARAVAEMAIALLIALLRRVPMSQGYVKGGGWSFEYFEGRELDGKIFGLLGAGNVGRELVVIAKGLGMHPLVYTKHPSPERAAGLGVAEFVSLDAILAQADFLAIALPANAETEHLIGAKELLRMKPTAILVDTGRGKVVNTLALAQALYEQRLAGAALDVIENEPFNLRNADLRVQEMVNSNNVILTPHIAFNTRESTNRIGQRLIEELKALV